MAIGYGLDGRGIGVRVPVEARFISSLYAVQRSFLNLGHNHGISCKNAYTPVRIVHVLDEIRTRHLLNYRLSECVRNVTDGANEERMDAIDFMGFGRTIRRVLAEEVRAPTGA